MQRTYEVMFIVRPDMADEEVDKLVSTLESGVNAGGGVVKIVERMGRRRLAYSVRRFHDGNYVLFTVHGTGETIHELERRLRVTEPVIKFLTVRTDEEDKRLEKVKKIRASRVRRSSAPAAEAGAEPAAAVGA
jgi:small subunit ribosomal protein S6